MSHSATVFPPSVASSPVTPPLDPSFYNLDEEESSFLKTQTGIKDDQELKRHILEVQAEAYAVRRDVLGESVLTTINLYFSDTSISVHQGLRFHFVITISLRVSLITLITSLTGLRFSKHSAYKTVLALGKERPGVILLDVGCCCACLCAPLSCSKFPCSWKRHTKNNCRRISS